MTIKTFFVSVTAILAISTSARADALDVFNTIGRVAGAVSDSRESLAEGRLDVPSLSSKNGGKHGGHEGSHARKHK